MNDPDIPPNKARIGNYGVGLSQEPDLFEPLKAYRHWKISGDQLVTPIHNELVWQDGENQSLCQQLNTNSHTAHLNNTRYPLRSCSCGFYSVWSDENDYAKHTNPMSGIIFGVVELYGIVCVGSLGARATKARIAALHLPPPIWSPFRRMGTPALIDSYPSVRFYKSRDNLVAAEGVGPPTNLIRSAGYPGPFG